ncbi:hypothetical protein [Prolixibacter sp. NT017]|uniref:hypothetical protein n=1 Tax=Prolixibacter sp. NT017 TaxID=2652390 RepID=UPI0012751DF2|nr:hypothetical protein [Prolixibacter sp. NT017]GET24702.1 hypothetical protein NT017_10310 [Prolixibacter sp. NT017]
MKTNRILNTILGMTLLVAMAGCDSFFEDDISNRTVELVSPADQVETDILTQTFYWDVVKGASSYRLQIVTPSFANAENLVLDTLVTDNKYTYSLFPAEFEWRVRAENSVYQSGWSSSHLTIYSSDDLTRQKVQLVSPHDAKITNSTDISFVWDALYNADNYQIAIYKGSWEGETVVAPVSVDGTSYEGTLSEGTFFWGVQAQNQTSETSYTIQSMVIDQTPPNVPVLTSPENNATVASTSVQFAWNSSDSGSGIAQDTVKVYSDKNLSTLVDAVASSDQQAQITLADRTTYYWTVLSVDKAGNVGARASVDTLTVRVN